MADWKRTSRFVAMATPVRMRTAASARCRPGPRPVARTRPARARPPSDSARRTSAEPSANARPTGTVRDDAAPTAMTAARIGPAQGA